MGPWVWGERQTFPPGPPGLSVPPSFGYRGPGRPAPPISAAVPRA
jgi:hypothetical protein